jgi:signal transduction histidine kinase
VVDFHVNRVTRVGSDWIQFEIRDTGVGMTERQVLEVFRPMVERGASALAQRGPGMGLVTSKRLSELLGGEIEIESERGVGTLIRVLLPAEPSTTGPGA